MTVFNFKKRFIISLVLLTLSLSLFVLASWGWFTQLFEEDQSYTVGNVDVELVLYFVDELGNPILDENDDYVQPPLYQIPNTSVYKPGVYKINVVNIGEDYFFSNLRIKVLVHSNVDTYFRIKIIEQLTMIYTNTSNVSTEIAVPLDTFMPLKYETTNWYNDTRIYDDYIYYQDKVKRVGINNPLEILLINNEPDLFVPYSIGYSMQLSFLVEAVQANNGPQENWNLPTAPWGSSW